MLSSADSVAAMELAINHNFRDTLDTRTSSDFPSLSLSYIRNDGKAKLTAGNGTENSEGVQEDYPLWKLALVTSAWVGVQCLWVSEFSLTQPYMEYLGMSADVAALTWIWGPITGN